MRSNVANNLITVPNQMEKYGTVLVDVAMSNDVYLCVQEVSIKSTFRTKFHVQFGRTFYPIYIIFLTLGVFAAVAKPLRVV